MSSVGWDSSKTYSTEELQGFAAAAATKMRKLGVDPSEELSRFGTKPF